MGTPSHRTGLGLAVAPEVGAALSGLHLMLLLCLDGKTLTSAPTGKEGLLKATW